MIKLIKLFLSSILMLLILFILFLNIKLYYKPVFADNSSSVNTDVVKQLHYLKSSLHNGAANKMQQVYPEGFVFTQAVYGLSWAEVAAVADHNLTLYKEAHEEISYALREIQSPQGKIGFDKNLPISFGAYYAGWCNYLLGKKLLAENASERSAEEIRQFKHTCEQIAGVLQAEVYPESYKSFSWPADVFVAVASLKLHDKLFMPLFDQHIQSWLEKVKASTDQNGFIPYAATTDGKPLEIARGSSESLILNFLIDIDTVFAKQQFTLYKEKFLDHRFGLPGIREFPKGNNNTGNVDSGPVILDMGSAATIVGMSVLALYKDNKNAIAIRNGIEAFGLAYSNNNEKKYLLGMWPMADVFIAWAHTAEINKGKELSTIENWRLRFQFYSLILLTILLLPLRLLLRKNKQILARSGVEPET